MVTYAIRIGYHGWHHTTLMALVLGDKPIQKLDYGKPYL